MLWWLYSEVWRIVCLQLWVLHAHDNSYRHHSEVDATTAGCDANLYPRTIYFLVLSWSFFLCCQALLVNGELMRRTGVALAAELCANDIFFLSVLTDVFYMCSICWFGAMCSLTLHDIAVMWPGFKPSVALVHWNTFVVFSRSHHAPSTECTRCSAGVASSGHPIKATCSVFFVGPFRYVVLRCCHPMWVLDKLCSCQVLSRDLASTLSTLAGELSRSDGEDTLEEQTAVLLQLPCKLEDVCAQLCEKLQKFHCRLSATSLRRSALCPLCFALHLPQMLSTTTSAAQCWHSLATSWRKFLFSRANHGSMPYLLVLGVIAERCQFSPLWQGHGGVPAAKTQPVGSLDGSDIVLKLITSNEPPPVNIRVVIGKAAATSATYRPQPSTSPLYDFCELQTLMLRIWIGCHWETLIFGAQTGPLAKRLRQRFYEMLQCNVKLGKRTLSEFRADESTSPITFTC